MNGRLWLVAGTVAFGSFQGFLVLVATASSISATTTTTTTTTKTMTHIECGVYLAPSSIPGAGLGMYNGNRTLAKDAMVTDEDILIPIVERPWHSQMRLKDKKFLWDEYIWNSDTFPFTAAEIGEDLMGDMTIASPGVGSAANSYISMVNVADDPIRIGRESLPRDSPGHGAFTIYHGRSFRAADAIEPGQELFVNYGEEYFTSREHIYGFLPMPDDFERTDRMLRTARNLSLYNSGISAAEGELTTDKDDRAARNEVWEDLIALMKDISDNVYEKSSRILNAIPPEPSSVQAVLKDGGTAWQDYNRSIRDLEWLEERGQCADNIGPGKSTIPDAARGAFATRFIPEGGLVSPAPLVHIGDLDTMAMFMEHVYNKWDVLVPNRHGIYTWQLMINYCFAHEQSTLLLCPYGLLSSLINHSSGEGANTRIQWSEGRHMRHPEWRQYPVDQWSDENHAGLQFDFVATRDIAEGEEIFIDYGSRWQDAWDKHVDTFRFEEHRSDRYRPAYELNELLLRDENGASFELRSEDDRDYRLDGVQLYCRGWYIAEFRGARRKRWKEKNPMCGIVRKLAEDSYLVRIIDWKDRAKRRFTKYHEEEDLVWGLPRAAFFFDDLPYFRDIHQEWAFRHPMMIPDDVFPEIWKNANYEGGRAFLEFVADSTEGQEKNEKMESRWIEMEETQDEEDDEEEDDYEYYDEEYEEDGDDDEEDNDDYYYDEEYEEDGDEDDDEEHDDEDGNFDNNYREVGEDEEIDHNYDDDDDDNDDDEEEEEEEPEDEYEYEYHDDDDDNEEDEDNDGD